MSFVYVCVSRVIMVYMLCTQKKVLCVAGKRSFNLHYNDQETTDQYVADYEVLTV